MFNRCQDKHRLIAPFTLLAPATNIPTYKATKIHTLTPLTSGPFFFKIALKALSSWFESNHLTVNSTKTQALSVGPCAYHYSLFLNNARIEFLRSIKILGVTLDKDLSYKEHISDQLKKAYAKASALRRIRRFLPHDAMIELYKAFILPHLEYCSPLFVGIGTGQRNRLEDGNCYMLRTLIGHTTSCSLRLA